MANEDAFQQSSNVMDWDTYFMATAILARHRSKDPEVRVGACIVNDDKKIIGTGYNGHPTGCPNLPLDENPADPLDCKHFYMCHAEMNAIIYRNTADVKGCTMYVSRFPCNECAKTIIQSGIKKVIYISDEKADKPKYQASKRMLDAARVEYEVFKPTGKVNITFSPYSLSDYLL